MTPGPGVALDGRQFWRAVLAVLASLLLLRLAGYWPDRLPGARTLALLLAAAHLLPGRAAALRPETVRAFAARHAFGLLLALTAVLALAVRLPGYAADLGHVPLDIDEHRLANNIRHFFVTGELLHDTVEHYPGLAFWVLSAASFLAYLGGLGDHNVAYPVHTPVEMFVGACRLANILIGAGIVVVTGIAGRQLAGAAVGILGAIFVALVPLSIETTVLVRNDPAMVLAVVGTVALALRMCERPGVTVAAAAGAAAGMATGIKYSGVFAFVPVLIAAAAAGTLRQRTRHAAVAFGGFAIAAAVTNHFVWADFPNFLRQLADQIAITGPGHWGATDNPAAFYVTILTRFGPGAPMLLLAAGFAAWTLSGRRVNAWLIVSVPLVYLWFMTGRPSQFPRWVYPLVPFVAICGSAALVALVAWAWRASPAQAPPVRTAVRAASLVLAGAVLWPAVSAGAVTASRRLTPPTHARVEAWLREHVAPGSVVLLGAGWLRVEESGVAVHRVPDLGPMLDGGLDALAPYDWVVVPEIYFGHQVLTQLGLVRRVQAARTFGGSHGYDFEIYSIPRMRGKSGAEATPTEAPKRADVLCRFCRVEPSRVTIGQGVAPTRLSPFASSTAAIPPRGQQVPV